MNTISDPHKFYLEFGVEGEMIECITDIEIDDNINRLQCPLKIMMIAEKVYNLTEGFILKDRMTGITGPVLNPKDIFELSLIPYIPLKEVKMMMGVTD